MSLPEESLWCSKCKREHGAQDLGIVWVKHEPTNAETMYVVNGQDALNDLQEELGLEEYFLLEIDTLCK